MVYTIQSMSDRADVLVIGAGAIGLACAHYARRSGRDVRVVDKGAVGMGASWGNAGLVPLSAVAPLAVPGVISTSLRSLGDRDGAFRLSPRPDPQLIRWLFEFRRQCTWPRAHGVAARLALLMRESQLLLERLVAEEGLQIEYSRAGTLSLCATQAGLASLLKANAILETVGIVSTRVSREEAVAMEPVVSPAVVGGLYHPEDRHVHPGKLVHGLAERLRDDGVRFMTHTEVREIVVDGGRAVGVRTDAGMIRASEVVLAAGIESARLMRRHGVELMVLPAKGYHVESASFPRPRMPLRLSEVKAVVTTAGAAGRITSKLELTRTSRISARRIISGVPRLAASYLRGVVPSAGFTSWCGFRPLTPDSAPYIGRPRDVDGLVVATGHGQLGLALAPITGALVSDLLAGSEPRVPLERFGFGRFAPRERAPTASRATTDKAI